MKKIKLTQGYEAVVDDEDFDFLSKYSWRVQISHSSGPYAIAWIGTFGSQRVKMLMHRLLMNALPNQFVDHRDGNGLNCRKSNLRFATKTQNQQNRPKQRVGAVDSKFKGVCKRKNRPNGVKVWRADIRVDGKLLHLGRFKNPEEAAREYDKAAIKYFGEFARLNFERTSS